MNRHARARLDSHDSPSTPLRVIAVTGTSGKTTTAWLTAAALTEAGLRVGVLSDLGCLGLDDDLPRPAAYARPAALARWLERLAEEGCSHAVVELPARALAAHARAGFRCDTLAVTNLAASRVDPLAAAMTRRPAAARLTAALAKGGCLVSGVGGSQLGRLVRRLPQGATCLTAGLAEGCDLQASPVEAGLFGRTVLARHGGQIVPLSLDAPVVPIVRDSLVAAAIAARYGVPLDVAVRGIESVGSVPGRMERIDRGQDAAVFIDMPTSGHALSATLASLRRLTAGQLGVIAEESLARRLGSDEFGPLVARHCDRCVLAPATVLADDAADADLAAYARIDRLLESLGRDDCLLVLGAGRRSPEPPEGEPAGRFPLAMLVDGWLQIAAGGEVHAPRRAA
jgi:UDP-N-acetylmuramoyl-L-alanyl-D-glutamate--2,6-diaminopimelate ligase